MATELARIAELSAQNPTMVFTSIAHLINVKLLRECHEKMDADKAVGIDGVTKEEYEEKFEENLVDLVDRMKKKSYKPKHARRVEIPKDNGKTRPLETAKQGHTPLLNIPPLFVSSYQLHLYGCYVPYGALLYISKANAVLIFAH